MAHAFRGYIHLKAIPGASEELLAEAGLWADRLSVNIELPTQRDLDQLAPQKKRRQIEQAMAQVKQGVDASRAERRPRVRQAPRFAPAGQSTQMVIGATETSDAQILRTSSELYQSFQLRRVYYSAYSPISDADSRLPAKPPPLVREHRLYQADWLLRHYGFDAGEITPSDAPDLDLEVDPKLAWALRNRGLFPVDLNTAEREMLLRVPGVGVRNVARILKMRRHQAVRLCHLERLRVPLGRARPFIVTADQGSAPAQLDSAHLARALRTDNRQLDLFEAASAAVTGQL